VKKRYVACLLAVVVLSPAPLAIQMTDIDQLARCGWERARAAAKEGGAAESLAPARECLAKLERWAADSTWRWHVEYARSLIAAAIAAAQDERQEMELHLVHARSLVERLRDVMEVDRWRPLAIDEAEGELWFEVDDYERAEAAYQRATAANASQSVWLGLARSAARLQHTALACKGYREWVLSFPGAFYSHEAREYITAHCNPD